MTKGRARFKLSLLMAYFAEGDPVPNRPGEWNSLNVSIFQGENPEDPNKTKIGEYKRNYPRLFKTFHPFTKEGQDYALYSRDYTETRVMKLPECEDIGGEESDGWGFCPTEYHIPQDLEEEGYTLNKDKNWGLIAGCYWGDDSSYKVQFLDLSRVSEGILKRDDRFGYVEIPEELDLKDSIGIFCVEGDGDALIQIASPRWYWITQDGGVKTNGTHYMAPEKERVRNKSKTVDESLKHLEDIFS